MTEDLFGPLLIVLMYAAVFAVPCLLLYAIVRVIVVAIHPERRAPPRTHANKVGWVLFLGGVMLVLMWAWS